MFCFFLPSLEDEHMAVLTLGESHKDLNDNTNNKARGCFWFWTVKKALINSHYTNCHTRRRPCLEYATGLAHILTNGHGSLHFDWCLWRRRKHNVNVNKECTDKPKNVHVALKNTLNSIDQWRTNCATERHNECLIMYFFKGH